MLNTIFSGHTLSGVFVPVHHGPASNRNWCLHLTIFGLGSWENRPQTVVELSSGKIPTFSHFGEPFVEITPIINVGPVE